MPGDSPRLEQILSIQFDLHVETGLRVGATDSSIAIGGQENVIIRDPVTGQPYVPGSSIKGKIRSLTERTQADRDDYFNQQIGQVRIHSCTRREGYESCRVCQLFGIAAPSRERWFCQTRLRVHDLRLTPASEEELRSASTELPYTEVKSEVAIDRITSAAVPRTMERVPAGARFGPGTFSIFLYEADEPAVYLGLLARGMELLEYDYLGGGGARGSGRVRFDLTGVEVVDLPLDGRSYRRQFGSLPASTRELVDAVPAIAEWVQAH